MSQSHLTVVSALLRLQQFQLLTLASKTNGLGLGPGLEHTVLDPSLAAFLEKSNMNIGQRNVVVRPKLSDFNR